MRKYPLIVKELTLGIILLFFSVAVIPSLTAQVHEQASQARTSQVASTTIQVIRYEYCSDGRIEKQMLALPQSEFRALQTGLSFAHTAEETLDLYKRYNLIPRYVSMASLRTKVHETSMSTFDDSHALLTKTPLDNPSSNGLLVNSNCDVYGEDGYTLRVSLGLSPLIGRFNFLLLLFSPGFEAQSKDVVLCRASGFGDILTNGTFGEKYCAGHPFFLTMVGFVGYILLCPFFLTFYEYFIGVTKATVALAIFNPTP